MQSAMQLRVTPITEASYKEMGQRLDKTIMNKHQEKKRTRALVA
jgi:hypothetical protein